MIPTMYWKPLQRPSKKARGRAQQTRKPRKRRHRR